MEKLAVREYDGITFWKEGTEEIVHFAYSPNTEMDLLGAKRMVQHRLEYTNNDSQYFMIDVTNLKSATKEAREYMSDPEGGLRGVLGGAFISNKVLTTVIVNLFFKINKPTVPARFFTNKEEAVKWLKKIKNQAVL